MKRGGIINARLAGEIARLGHTDLLVICDSGLPIPRGPEVVDLAFQPGTPPFETVFSGILQEIVVEGSVVAREVVEANPASYELLSGLPDLELVPHVEFKRRLPDAKLIIRTGEATPYSNVGLICGVPY